MVKAAPKKKRIRNPVVTREKLLQATIDLVSEKGAAALSLKDAAELAGVSRGVAYLHFADRDQLLHEAKNWMSDRLQEGVQSFDRGASFHDRTVYTTKIVLEHPEASRLMINAAMAGKGLDRLHPLYKRVVKMIKELSASGRARSDIDPEIMTYIMFGSIASTVMLGAHNQEEDVNELAERFTKEWGRILRDGIYLNVKKGKTKNTATSKSAWKLGATSRTTRKTSKA
jgi:AcrR family transcriptional regulator